ncbi:Carbazole 1,9a-dioxygenase, terminal oxygenase component CarAa [compost metagenome]
MCDTPEERQKHQHRFDHVYKPLCLHGFNDCDIYAREAMQNFYADGTGWDDEQLVATDISPITWRKLASRWNRGIAKPGRGVKGAVKDTSLIFKETADGHRPGYKVRQIAEE